MPDTTWPVTGHPPGSLPGPANGPGFDATLDLYDTSTAIRAYARLPDPHLTRHGRLFHIAHHDAE